MTELKDVIHLYLGCEVFDDYDNNYKELISVDLKEGNCRIATKGRVTQHLRKLEEIKPILRPLSDMTEEEFLIYYGKLYSPDEFVFLLKQGYDLFNLIESGQAKDATITKHSKTNV